MHLHTSGRIELLAARLAEVLRPSSLDPMTSEWVAVPTDGMRRWLPLELARHLGTGDKGLGDGVAANISLPFPGSLRDLVLNAGRAPDEPDPWQVDRLVWTVLAAAERHGGEAQLSAFTALPPGASSYSKARRVADLFDRYNVHRPAMVRSWESGQNVDGIGRKLPKHHAWQPYLWRLVRELVGEASPPERMPELLERLAAGELSIDLPARLSVFGLTTLPGGGSFIELSRAVAVSRELHLFFLEPSPVGEELLRQGVPARAGGGLCLRSDDASAEGVHHPLLRSWGRLQRETSLLLADAQAQGVPAPDRLERAPANGRDGTVLSQLQADIRANVSPSGDLRVAANDRSVQFHACHGSTRQVEVLRDVILHLLADRELNLVEDDVLVVCPSLDRLAPVVDAVFGATSDDRGDGDAHAPLLRYRIADRSVRDFNAALSATADLLAVVSGRFQASVVLDFLSLTPVRSKYQFTDDDLSQISQWVTEAQVRWGLDPEHRDRLGVPSSIVTNTWRAALDRLLLGSAVFDDQSGLSVGDTAVIGVEGSDVDTVGRLAEVLRRLADLAEETLQARSISEWVDLLGDSARSLFDMPSDLQWQLQALWSVLDDVVSSVPDDAASSGSLLEFTDVRRVFGDRLMAVPGRPDFFRGGITVSSLTPLRGIPFRVVCLLGMDEHAFTTAVVEGDDLAALAPMLGDPDSRAEDRLSLLEAVMAAGDHLILLRDGFDVRTNHSVPPAVIVEELREALTATVNRDDGAAFSKQLEMQHPRQSFDERCFIPGELIKGASWGFDGGDLAGAEARRLRVVEEPPFMVALLPDTDQKIIELSELHQFLKNPVAAFVAQRLGARLPRSEESVNDRLPVALESLEKWHVGDRLLKAVLRDVTVDDCVRVERQLGTLPPAVLGDELISELTVAVMQLADEADLRGFRRGPGREVPIKVDLSAKTCIVGSVLSRLQPPAIGSASILYSSTKPFHRVAAWLDLMVLVATDPAAECRSLVVTRPPTSSKPPGVVDLVPRLGGADGHAAALTALEVIVDCFRRGQREPLPLFPTLSYNAHNSKAKPSDWFGFGAHADGDDPATSLVFGHLGFRSLMELPSLHDDPPGTGARVERLAHHLYGAMETSVMDRGSEEAGAH